VALIISSEVLEAAMRLRQEKCDTPGCKHKRLVRLWTIILVSLVCTAVLISPILSSTGLTLNSTLYPSVLASFKVTVLTVVLCVVLLISIIMGGTREYENEWFCIIDSAGIPAIAAAAFFGSKLLG
jgi:hypothetical protein